MVVYAPDDSQYHSVSVDVLDLIYNYPKFGSEWHEKPFEFQQTIEGFLIEAQQRTIQSMNDQQARFEEIEPTVKDKINARFVNVPPVIGDVVLRSIRDIQQQHMNKLVITFGTVMRTTNVNSRELKKKFQCKTCEKKFICESQIDEYNQFQLPVRCDNMVPKKENPFFKITQQVMRKGKAKGGEQPPALQTKMQQCGGRTFVAVEDADLAEYSDY